VSTKDRATIMTKEDFFWLNIINECTSFVELQEENFEDNIWFDLNFSEDRYRKLLMKLALKLKYGGFEHDVNHLEELIICLKQDNHCKEYYNLHKSTI